MSKQVRERGEHHEMMIRLTYNDICRASVHYQTISHKPFRVGPYRCICQSPNNNGPIQTVSDVNPFASSFQILNVRRNRSTQSYCNTHFNV